MSETIRYGMFGLGEIERDDDGYIELPVIIQESGLYVGSAPPEMRIYAVLPHDDIEFGKQYIAKLNRRTDLPFYLAKAKIKVISGSMIMITDNDLLAESITPLGD